MQKYQKEVYTNVESLYHMHNIHSNNTDDGVQAVHKELRNTGKTVSHAYAVA